MNSVPNMDDIMINIHWAVNPYGDPMHLAERDRAVQYLLDHADQAFPKILELVRSKPQSLQAAALIDIMPLFQREDCVPLLRDLMFKAVPDTSRAAARALAQIASPDARMALLAALQSRDIEVLIAAVDSLRLWPISDWCTRIQPLLEQRNANLRYYALNTAIELHCLSPQAITDIARHDEDKDVRDRAREALQD